MDLPLSSFCVPFFLMLTVQGVRLVVARYGFPVMTTLYHVYNENRP